MQNLVNRLNKASNAYYNEDKEIISNFEYDALFDELVALEKETGIVLPDSPTANVGSKTVEKLQKVTHAVKALSLDKTKDIEVLKDFLGDKDGVLSWKLDGLTVQATYECGKLVSAATRGNGEIGEDITHIATHKNFIGLPNEIEYKKHLIVRGEATITYSEFERINAKLPDEDKYKNPRNLVSGTIRQLDSKILNDRQVIFGAFQVVESTSNFNSHVTNLQFLFANGFNIVAKHFVDKEILESFVKTSEENIAIDPKIVGFCKNRYADDSTTNQTSYEDVPVDGLVLVFNDIKYGKSLGQTNHHYKNGMAFKFKDEEKETTVREIFWSASRTGLINPVAVFDPIDLEGTTVTRASVHNVSILKHLNCGVGSVIKVYKANMIIPQISKVVTPSQISIPCECPVCKGKTVVKTSDSSGIEMLYCENPDCRAKLIKKFERYCERNAMNIVGVSEAILETLINEDILSDIVDLYDIEKYENRIVNLDGFGQKSYTNIYNSIEASKNVRFSNFLYSLGIDNFGKDASKIIAKNMTCEEFYENIYSCIDSKKESYNFQQYDGIGEVIEKSLIEWFNIVQNLNMFHVLSEYILNIENEKMDTSNADLNGITFVVTGSVSHFANRDELKDFIAKRGGKVAGSVSAKTNYLINNDTTSTSGKNKKAKELGIPIISEEDFLKM